MPVVAFIPAIIAAVGAGVGVAQTVRAGRASRAAGVAQREASDSVAGVYDWNADIADFQAADADARGAYEEARFRASAKGLIGSARAVQAASGIDVNYGSAVDVQADIAELTELDALTIRTNTMREAWGYRVSALDTRQRAQIARREGVYLEQQGRETARQMYLGAGQQVLGAGASLVASRYGFLNRTSTPGRLANNGSALTGTVN